MAMLYNKYHIIGFNTKGSSRLLNYYARLLVFTCRQSDGLLESGGKYDTKFLVLSFSVDSKRHKS